LINIFTVGNFTVGSPLPEYPYTLENAPTNSSITLNPDGSVASWQILLSFESSGPAIGDNPPYSNIWFLESNYGIGTCNCEFFRYDYDLYSQRPYHWGYVNTLGFEFRNENMPGNWVIEQVDVPEPMNYLLMFSGLSMICLLRLRKSRDA
jgi:hypothetical protein